MAKDVATKGAPESLAAIDSFEAALQFAAANGELLNVADMGDGFTVIKVGDKRKLIGVPFVTVGINFGEDPTSHREYVVVRLVTKSGSKLILTDGSTGIMKQIVTMIERNGGKVPDYVYVPNGLTVSEYVYTNPQTGEQGDAETYYFDLTGEDSTVKHY